MWGSISVWISTVSQSTVLTSASLVTRSRRQPPMTLGQMRHHTPGRISFRASSRRKGKKTSTMVLHWTALVTKSGFLQCSQKMSSPPGFNSLYMDRICSSRFGREHWPLCMYQHTTLDPNNSGKEGRQSYQNLHADDTIHTSLSRAKAMQHLVIFDAARDQRVLGILSQFGFS